MFKYFFLSSSIVVVLMSMIANKYVGELGTGEVTGLQQREEMIKLTK